MKVYSNKHFSINLFIREYNPTTITGCLYLFNNNVKHIAGSLSAPITINTEQGVLIPYADLSLSLNGDNTEMIRATQTQIVTLIVQVVGVINNLPKHTVVADTPKSSIYYPKKKATGIRVTNRPIYYILNKNEKQAEKQVKEIKPIGHLSYTHSFKVRGHWRRINPHSIGKNRNGEYKVYGYTFVREYVKGEGELVKRGRVVK